MSKKAGGEHEQFVFHWFSYKCAFQEVVRHRTLGRRALTLEADNALMLVRYGATDVDHREQSKYICL